MSIADQFKKVLKKELPKTEFLVPMLRWFSGSEKNIEAMQRINRKFSHGNHKVFIGEVTLNNKVTHFIKFPTVTKDDAKLHFFYNDLCAYLGWTRNELDKNFDVIDIDVYKPIIARAFAYDKKQRKELGLKAIHINKR